MYIIAQQNLINIQRRANGIYKTVCTLQIQTTSQKLVQYIYIQNLWGRNFKGASMSDKT